MYKLSCPQQVIFGLKAMEKIGTLVPENVNVLVVSGSSARRNGVLDDLSCFLAPRKVFFYDHVDPEPTIQQVDEVRKFMHANSCSAVIAVGGGSALDVGKVAAAAGDSELPTAEYFFNRVQLPVQGYFMAALPTTAGTGAEVTPNGVFTDWDSNIKQSIRGGSVLPTLALVDPLLCVKCPQQVTAASGLDALTQGIESYIARNANNATRAWAMQSVKLINDSIERAHRNGSDLEARSDMSEGTMLGAMAFAVSGLGAVHGLAHPIGAVTHQPHGLVCGVLLPQVLKWNLPVCKERLQELAQFMGYKTAGELIERVSLLLEKFNISSRLSVLGLQENDIDWVVKHSRSGSMRSNPRELSDDELTLLLQEIL